MARGATVDGVEVESYHISDLSAGEVRTIMEGSDALVFGIPTVACDIPKPMRDLLACLGTVKLKTTIAALFGSYCWSGEACKKAEERLKEAGLRLVGNALPTTAAEQCQALGRTVADEVMRTA